MMNSMIKSAEKNLKISTLLTFIGINLKYITGNLMKPLFLLDILKPPGHEHHYEIHVPNLPDICGDIVTVIILAFAYLFMTSPSVKKVVLIVLDKGRRKSHIESFQHSMRWTRSIFFVAIIGFGLYFFSKYYLSLGLEVFGEEEEGEGFFIMSLFTYLNYWVELGSALILVHAYCKYVNPNNIVAFLLYSFFFIRSLFATNMLGLSTHYDIYVGATAIDILVPVILVYSIFCINVNLRKSTYQFAQTESGTPVVALQREL